MKALDRWFYRQIAVWCVIFKRFDIAAEYWERIRATAPNDIQVLTALAHLKIEMGDKAAAIELLRQAVALDPKQGNAWFNLGFLIQEQEQHPEALEAFARCLEIDEKNDRAWYGRALSLIKLERIDEAVVALKRNTALQPMSPYGWYQLAHAHLRLGQRELAEKAVRTLAKFEPKVALKLESETGIKSGVNLPF